MISKEQIIGTVNTLEENFTIEEVFEKILLIEKIEKGLEQSRNGLLVSEDELENRIKQWSF